MFPQRIYAVQLKISRYDREQAREERQGRPNRASHEVGHASEDEKIDSTCGGPLSTRARHARRTQDQDAGNAKDDRADQALEPTQWTGKQVGNMPKKTEDREEKAEQSREQTEEPYGLIERAFHGGTLPITGN